MDCDKLCHGHGRCRKWTLDRIHGLHFWRRLGRFGVLVSLSGAYVRPELLACLLATRASSSLMIGFRGNANGNCQDYDYKPAWIARYDEGMITGLGLLHGVEH
jgi:hypothetical protein